MKKIKILHISETFASGVYTYIKNVCNFLESDNRFEVYIVYSTVRKENESEEVIKREFPNDVRFIPISLSREISIKSDFKGLISIRKIIKEINPNIVHLHSSKAGILGRMACIGLNQTQVLYTPHGYSFIREDLSKTKKSIFYNIEKYITKIFKGTIVACGDSEYEIGRQFTDDVLLVRNGIKLRSLNVIVKQVNERSKIGTCGRIHLQKDPYLFNEIAKSLPECDFIWIGDGELKELLTSSNIIITGWKTNEEVMTLVNELDVFISTSLWEGLPFNIIEAMALGKPIVSNDIDGNRITIENGENGYLCSSNEEFVQAIHKSLENKEKYGVASEQRVNRLFDLDKNLEELKKIYLKVGDNLN
ncbi:hypothetical protein HMPREF9713_02117 [Myroides odoratimimus CCUG 12700]|uniref:glycosyltransferase n=1 Tax=Myroides odoratimimus TaxID=76832 RepID=UPI0003542588|nr:glycosyltransferase [Myroides odoratimimus]EPH10991.1 hypothetical protein HMPREF9713_02117 [Myroides odoratimimus CCUG 12700]